MSHDVIMPALGMAQDSGYLVAWHKSEGDTIAKGDVLFEVETDKAAMEVEAQAEGYLSQVTGRAGESIPVGQVIAKITQQPEQAKTTAASTTSSSKAENHENKESLPQGEAVIMPALGMAQDMGHIVRWNKALGEAVNAEDVLFEVETDKSVMEVEAGVSGYFAAMLYPEKSDAPVGEIIAIITDEKPKSLPSLDMRGPKTDQSISITEKKLNPKPAQAVPTATNPARQPKSRLAQGDKILASPKLRRLALEQGLDLSVLAKAGQPQPYHIKDLGKLKELLLQTTPSGAQELSANQLKANVKSSALNDFITWAENRELGDASKILAELLSHTFGKQPSNISVITNLSQQFYFANSRFSRLVQLNESPQQLDCILYDLRATALCDVAASTSIAPSFTIITLDDQTLSLQLDYLDSQLNTASALTLITAFSQIVEQPLRRLL